MNRRNKGRSRTILNSPITLVLALILFVFLARSAYRLHARAADTDTRLADTQANLGRLESKRVGLEGRIAKLSTEEGLEAAMREKYHAIEPGENVAVIISKDLPLVPPAMKRLPHPRASGLGYGGSWVFEVMRV